MNHEKHEKARKKKVATEPIETTEIGFDGLVDLFEQTQTALRAQAARAVNSSLVARNWLFGWYIVEFEKQSSDRAEIYGKNLMAQLSERLTAKLGKGFSRRSLDQFRQFYEQYPEIGQTLFAKSLKEFQDAVQRLLSDSNYEEKKIWQALFAKSFQGKPQTLSEESGLARISWALSVKLPLSWSHYLFLMGVSNVDERRFYELESANGGWSLRELKRQFDASLYERLALSRDKEGVKALSQNGLLIEKHADVIKDPYVLEFLGLEEKARYSEIDLETAIIDKLEHFLLELGKGFLFEARQKRFTFDEEHFFVDLVFYNRLLRCYVIIDLKIGDLKHQDLGQMQMYVNYFDRYVKLEDEEPTIGIILCKKKKDSLVEITLPEGANIHAAKYQTYLPDKEALKRQLESAQAEWEAHNEN
ncbi:MAG: PDDEXK nuclease domain-containing protein [Thermodesulfobacteriota bacterium]|nr:PDDEXK nuclease domain-containing protein [Thermodesulfobacteriota bacterium]